MTRHLIACSLFLAVSQLSAQSAVIPQVLPESTEVELALSAAPAHLREAAGVFALTNDGYRMVRATANGFTCIVNRDSPRSLKPTCFDAEGTATIVPKVVAVGGMLLRGATSVTIDSMVQAGFASGRFIAPRRPGVAYMLSGRIANENPRTGSVSGFPPHIMFYAPHLTNEDIGVTPEALRQNPRLPFIAYQGPHGFMVVVSDPGT